MNIEMFARQSHGVCTCIKKLGRIQLWTAELAALDQLKNLLLT